MFTTVVPRGGRLVTHRSGARCYEPSPLPPSPDLSLSPAQWRRVTDAERALGRLEGKLQGTRWAPALVQLTALQEAVAAARLDGGHLELRQLLWWQLDGERAEVGGHTGALRLAAQHATLVVEAGSLDIESIHARLFQHVQGREGRGGQLRSSVIWLGKRGSTVRDAPYVPPSPTGLREHVASLSRYLSESAQWPRLVHSALAYYQAETLHPFLDGSGRVARILLVRCLAGAENSTAPILLRPSLVWARNSREHFELLQRLRAQGDFEGWIAEFSGSIHRASEHASSLVSKVESWLQESADRVLHDLPGQRPVATQLLEALPGTPLIDVPQVAEICDRNFANANILTQRLVKLGLLEEITGRRRNRRFVSPGLLKAIDEQM